MTYRYGMVLRRRGWIVMLLYQVDNTGQPAWLALDLDTQMTRYVYPDSVEPWTVIA